MRPPTRSLGAALLALSVATAGPAAFASEEPSTPGALSVAQADGKIVELPLRHTKVTIEVTAFVARAVVEQQFGNPFAEPVEAVYTFPLGERAAVDEFELQVGDRTIRGEIRPRDEARATYERARAAGHQAALLEQERPNVFTQSVANLEPGKIVTVRLRTVWSLPYERGFYRLTFPLVVGPRYVPGGSVADAPRIKPPKLPRGTRSGHDVEISVTIDAGVPLASLESPSHKTLVTMAGGRFATVALAPDDAIPNKDFLLRWSVSSDRPAVGVLAHRSALDGFFTLLVQPKGEVGPGEAMPKEITFVVDTSGSMSGVPLEASKRFAAKALHALGPRDTFNLIRFAGDNTVFSQDPLPNSAGPIEQALAWLNGQQGGGGTELLPAIATAFARPADPNRLRVVIFLTDGFVGNDQEILAAVGKVVGDARVYTVGIGTSVNHHLLDRMAEIGRGSYVFVRPDQRADDVLEAFRSWVTLPYVTDLAIDWGSLPVADLSPERLRDLGSGETLSIVGRYSKAAEGDVVVRGKLGGRYFEQSLHLVLPEAEPRNEALSSLWARGRIDRLLHDPAKTTTGTVEFEVTDLAVRYRLMSPYTSFVAVDDSVVVNANGEARRVQQALPSPEGSFGEPIVGDATVEEGTVEHLLVAAEVGSVSLEQHGVRTTFSSEFIADLPVAGGFYQTVIPLAEGVEDARGDGKPNVSAARERDFKTKLKAKDEVLETAFRLLADLAVDGKLSKSEGKPALANLLSLQQPSGDIGVSVEVHAVAAWALAEAALAVPGDASIAAARAKAIAFLVGLARPEGWPTWTGGAIDAESTRWALLVLSLIQPEAFGSTPVPAGQPSEDYTRLTASLEAAKSGSKPPRVTGGSSFDRFLKAIGRGHVKTLKAG